ncbi:hypothetical protein GCM10022380_79160 [Amycolatopsis tucumanensis]|uniref:Uncharacterized protein n=1 Tax=Amycolatopsis tucumanensis TaxID=401106 RepID=A0ABP7JP90_9PSEU
MAVGARLPAEHVAERVDWPRGLDHRSVRHSTWSIDPGQDAGSRRSTIAFETGVLDFFATESSGTSALASGK